MGSYYSTHNLDINHDVPERQKEEIVEQFSFELSKFGNSSEIIFLGDFNVTGSERKDKTIGQFGEAITNDDGLRLINPAEQNKLILNKFFNIQVYINLTGHKQ